MGPLFKPIKGSFLSFSEEMRSCPSKRFARVEFTAVLTAIFQKYSVELDVRAWASDEELEGIGIEEKKEFYGKAIERARTGIARCEQKVITLQMKKGDNVPLRLVERGTEICGDFLSSFLPWRLVLKQQDTIIVYFRCYCRCENSKSSSVFKIQAFRLHIIAVCLHMHCFWATRKPPAP